MGDTVRVVYDPADAENARIDELAELWFAPALLAVIGADALIIPPYTMWRVIRANPLTARHHSNSTAH